MEVARLSGENFRLQEVVELMASDNAELRLRIQDLECQGTEMAASVRHLVDEIHGLREESMALTKSNHEKEMEMHAITRSISWRMTKPARKTMDWLRRIFEN